MASPSSPSRSPLATLAVLLAALLVVFLATLSPSSSLASAAPVEEAKAAAAPADGGESKAAAGLPCVVNSKLGEAGVVVSGKRRRRGMKQFPSGEAIVGCGAGEATLA